MFHIKTQDMRSDEDMPTGENIKTETLKLRSIKLMKISDYPQWQRADNVKEKDENFLKDNK